MPLFTDTLPVYVELLKRILRFTWRCVDSNSSLVRNIASYGVVHARQKSCIGRNILLCCNYFDLRLEDFVKGNVNLDNKSFTTFCLHQLSQSELDSAVSLYEVLQVREGDLQVDDFSRDEIDDISKMIAC